MRSKPLTVIFVRHADKDIYQGGITPKGREEAGVLRDVLRPIAAGKSVAFFTSDQPRAIETGAVLADLPELADGAKQLEALVIHHEDNFLQGVGAHCPDDVEVVLCVSHAGRAERLAEGLAGRQLFQHHVKGHNDNSLDPDLEKDFGYAEGIIMQCDGYESGDAQSYELLRWRDESLELVGGKCDL